MAGTETGALQRTSVSVKVDSRLDFGPPSCRTGHLADFGAPCSTAGVSPETYQLRKGAARTNRAFYHALENLDLLAMRELWLDDPTVKCVHPGGELIVGSDRVMESWRLIFERSCSVRFELLDLELEVVGDLALANNIERLHIGLESGTVISEAAATNVYVRREAEWRMILHHASPIARRFFEE